MFSGCTRSAPQSAPPGECNTCARRRGGIPRCATTASVSHSRRAGACRGRPGRRPPPSLLCSRCISLRLAAVWLVVLRCQAVYVKHVKPSPQRHRPVPKLSPVASHVCSCIAPFAGKARPLQLLPPRMRLHHAAFSLASPWASHSCRSEIIFFCLS